jgi:two-component system, LytTR family, sensor kinase
LASISQINKNTFARTEINTWVVAITVIILMNVNFKTGEIAWKWIIAVFLGAFTISRIQNWAIPLLMQRAGSLAVGRIIAAYVVESIVVASVVSVIVARLMQFTYDKPFSINTYVAGIISFSLFTLVMTSIFVIQEFMTRWRASLLQEQELKQALLKAEFDNLKSQVNPHFLFNSLNILSALIPEDPKNAVNMVERMSKVFRYNLQNSDRNSIELSSELKIAEAYLFIHKMRFGDNLSYTIAISAQNEQQLILTQGLLTLIENALKHNECSSEKPLLIEISEEKNYVVVRNNYQPKSRQFVESNNIGLANLQTRYGLLTTEPVLIVQDNEHFTVKIPFVKP